MTTGKRRSYKTQRIYYDIEFELINRIENQILETNRLFQQLKKYLINPRAYSLSQIKSQRKGD